MITKTKKIHMSRVARLETSGELREVIIKEDLLKPNEMSVLLCFKGKNGSGIVELSLDEVQTLSKEIEPKLAMMQNIKILRFEKEKSAKGKKAKNKK